jgi:hypothetical protein
LFGAIGAMINIDGDALVYIAGFAADSRNGPLSHSFHNIKLIIGKVLKATDESAYRIFLTHKNPKVNFRTELSKDYKANRKKKCNLCGGESITKEGVVRRFKTSDGYMKRRCFDCKKCPGTAYLRYTSSLL